MTALDEDIGAICALAAATGDNKSELDSRIAELAERFADLPEAEFAKAGPAGALLRVEIVRRKSDLSAYLSALAELPAESIAADPGLAPLSAVLLANGRDHAMREWGRGHVDATLATLDALTRVWPDDLATAADRLFVLVTNRIEDPRARVTVDGLSDAAWRHRRIALLATFFHTRKSGFPECLAAASRWAAADDGSIEGLDRLARQVSLTIAFRQMLGPDAAGPDGRGVPGWMLESRPLKALARDLLLLSRDLREFQDQIFHLVLANELQLPEPYAFFAVVLEDLATEDIASEFLGQILAFFVANNMLPLAKWLIERVRREASLLSCPHLAKFVCLYAQLAGDGDLEAAVLANILRDDPLPADQKGNARLQLRELRARAAAVGIGRFAAGDRTALLEARSLFTRDFPAAPLPAPSPDRRVHQPPRIAIALFGQLRDPDFTLAQVKNYFTDDIAANQLPPGAECRFLLATWNRQARKQLEPGYPVGEFIGLLPAEIGRIADPLRLRTSGDFGRAFPALFAELLRRSAQTLDEIGDAWADTARALLGDGALVEIADEAPVDRDIEEFCEVDPNLRVNSALRNQFKMYHRIAGIGHLVEAWENEARAPLDIIVLTRPDMLFETGSVMRHAQRLLSAGADSRIICDWNPGAMINEGLGDNIIIGTRRAMAALFAGYSRLSAVFRPDAGERADYRPRIWGHRFLGSTVFSEGIDLGLIPLNELRWRLHRGRLDLAAVRAAAAEDAERSPVPEVRDGLRALLASA